MKAHHFLQQPTRRVRGALLIGVDLVKSTEILERAYDDPLQITAAFNRNLLRHLNQQVGSDFNIDDWRHIAYFNISDSRIEMHLEAVRGNVLHWPEGSATSKLANVFTENYKWRRDDFASLLESAGFKRLQSWIDERGWFAVFSPSPEYERSKSAALYLPIGILKLTRPCRAHHRTSLDRARLFGLIHCLCLPT